VFSVAGAAHLNIDFGFSNKVWQLLKQPRRHLMRKVRFITLAVAVAAAFLVASTSRGDTTTFTTSLGGLLESPPNASPGTGSADVIWDSSANTMEVQVTFSDLLGTTTASHIHSPAVPPGTAGVATTTPTFTDFPLGVTSGTYDHTFDMTLASSYNPAYITANGGTPASAEAALFASLNAGTSYLNIHTTVVPGGEIRGFPEPVPEPGTLVLLAVGAFGVIGYRWRRRA